MDMFKIHGVVLTNAMDTSYRPFCLGGRYHQIAKEKDSEHNSLATKFFHFTMVFATIFLTLHQYFATRFCLSTFDSTLHEKFKDGQKKARACTSPLIEEVLNN